MYGRAGKARLYEQAYIGAKTVEQPAKGTRVHWIQDDGWGWSEVKFGNLRGWIENALLDCKERLSGYRTRDYRRHRCQRAG